VHLPHRSGDPVASILVEKLIYVAQIFMRFTGPGRALALPGDYENCQDRTSQGGLAKQHFLWAALPVKPNRDSHEEK